MGKWVEVKTVVMSTYAVEIEDNEGEEEAKEAVINDASFVGEIAVVGCHIAKNDFEAQRIRAHSDEEMPL